MGGHYHIKRWLTGTKGFSLLQKSRLDIEKVTTHFYVSAHYKQEDINRKSEIHHAIIHSSSESISKRKTQAKAEKDSKKLMTKNNVCPMLTILACTQTFIYLYLTITVRFCATWQSSSSLFYKHRSGFTVNMT